MINNNNNNNNDNDNNNCNDKIKVEKYANSVKSLLNKIISNY